MKRGIPRRTLLSTSVIAGLSVAGCQWKNERTAAGYRDVQFSYEWARFIGNLQTICAPLPSERLYDERIVSQVGILLKRFAPDPMSIDYALSKAGSAVGQKHGLITVHRDTTYELAAVYLRRGDTFPHHNHPGLAGVVYCAAGAVEVESFNLLPIGAESGNLLLQKVARQVLTPSRMSTLTATRGNVHCINALSDAVLLDVLCPAYDLHRVKEMRSYDIVKTARDKDRWILEAQERA
jgi:hypothetical protein